MITIYIADELFTEALHFTSVEEAEDELSRLEDALEEASGYAAWRIKNTIAELSEAIQEA